MADFYVAWGNKVNPGDRFCFRCSSKITLTSLHEEEVRGRKGFANDVIIAVDCK